MLGVCEDKQGRPSDWIRTNKVKSNRTRGQGRRGSIACLGPVGPSKLFRIYVEKNKKP